MKILILLLAVSLISCGKNTTKDHNDILNIEPAAGPVKSILASPIIIEAGDKLIELKKVKFDAANGKLTFQKFTDTEILALLELKTVNVELDIEGLQMIEFLKVESAEIHLFNKKINLTNSQMDKRVVFKNLEIMELISRQSALEVKKIIFRNLENKQIVYEYDQKEACIFGKLEEDEMYDQNCRNYRILESKTISALKPIFSDTKKEVVALYADPNPRKCSVIERELLGYEREIIKDGIYDHFRNIEEDEENFKGFRFVNSPKRKHYFIRNANSYGKFTIGYMSETDCGNYMSIYTENGVLKSVYDFQAEITFEKKYKVEIIHIRLNY